MTTHSLSGVRTAGPRRPMSLWRLELLRLVRTPRAISLGVVFVFIGLVEPVATRYENDLIGRLGRGVKVTLPPPTPADALNSYVSEIALIGLIVVVALSAGAFGFDTRHGLATFLRTRVSSMWQLVAPRFAVNAAAAAAAYLLGTLAAWYETRVLIGALPGGGVAAGMLCEATYLVFAVALTAFSASVVRNVLGSVAVTLGILLALPILASVHVIANWLPSALVNAPVELVNGTHGLSHFVPSLAVTVAATAGALALAVVRLRARET